MKKININDRLPNDNQYVLVHLTNDNWLDDDDPEGNRYFKVAKFIKGLSQQDRDELPEGHPRKNSYHMEDVSGNNQVPYCWSSFGMDVYFGQEVDFWFELPKLNQQGEL